MVRVDCGEYSDVCAMWCLVVTVNCEKGQWSGWIVVSIFVSGDCGKYNDQGELWKLEWSGYAVVITVVRVD